MRLEVDKRYYYVCVWGGIKIIKLILKTLFEDLCSTGNNKCNEANKAKDLPWLESTFTKKLQENFSFACGILFLITR